MTDAPVSKRDGEWNIWCHFPGILLPDRQGRPFAGGALEPLEFETWHALDDGYWQPVNYNDSKPVFLVVKLPGNREGLFPDKSFFEAFNRLRAEVHQAFLLVSAAPLPPPTLSCSYFRFDGVSDLPAAQVGASGRDWILSGHFRQPRWILGQDSLAESGRVLELIRETRRLVAGTYLAAGLGTLQLSALPDTTATLDASTNDVLPFVHCIAAVERIILPEPERSRPGVSLTRSFGEGAAVLMVDRVEKLEPAARELSDLYRLRSNLMHGRLRAHDLAEEDQAKLQFGRILLCQTVRRLLEVVAEQRGSVDIPVLLAHAYQDREAFGRLQHARGNEEGVR